MKTMKIGLWVLVSGLLLGGCNEGSTPAPIETPDASELVLPPLTTLAPGSTLNPRTLWPASRSVRRYVVLVNYSLPPDVSGVTPRPRFRAFGVDQDTRSFVFAVDGERHEFLGPFTEAMNQRGAILIGLPQGTVVPGQCGYKPSPPRLSASSREVTDLEGEDGGTDAGEEPETDGGSSPPDGCGTDPVGGIGKGGGTQGHEWDMAWVRNLPRWLDMGITPVNLQELAKHAERESPAP